MEMIEEDVYLLQSGDTKLFENIAASFWVFKY